MSGLYFFDCRSKNATDRLAYVFEQTLRFDFEHFGFALLDLGPDSDSYALRRNMVELKRGLSELLIAKTRKHLHYLSMGRFDQQVTTKFHLDGAPNESVLMLGYEPSRVQSRLFMADYTRCAHERGITPRQYLDQFNPMFSAGAALLTPYTTELTEFNPANFQILLINNSALPFSEERNTLLGVMHKAEIVNPTKDESRVVNSTMLGAVPDGAIEKFSIADQETFINTDSISKANY
ncbi:MAG TPA: hypothetical protein VEK08_14795 [Planctomycetota bacterium]|nr:hypothetical protein [Planctomycetota bacterium]